MLMKLILSVGSLILIAAFALTRKHNYAYAKVTNR
ncbi:hypothetical protein A5888_000596 [Enterococcus sp. 9E7_DIV0242]|uniref:Uncharacterized protein n=1 Tax=Candidatus Enterococcus clewellii TaxID=1834193 RepID=A0AAQ3VS08_9ENTE